MKKALLSILLYGHALSLSANEFSGYIGAETRVFYDLGIQQSSLLLRPEYYWQSQESDRSFAVSLHARVDSEDTERTHVDIRELLWFDAGDGWELNVGIGKVFWGVTESLHLVDVINQTDLVESPDGEEKLGQPMVHYTRLFDWGVIDAFVLPYFRERTMPGKDGLLGPGIQLSEAVYESGEKQEHVDLALRYSHSFSHWDVGVSAFEGTNRSPKLWVSSIGGNGEPAVRPYYDLVSQQSIDLQGVYGGWLLKLEWLHKKDSLAELSAAVAGFEYTFVGVAGSAWDVGVLAELQRDSADEYSSPSHNDVFVGARFAANDVQDTSLLVGVQQDMDISSSRAAFIEAGRRFGDAWRATLDVAVFDSRDSQDFFYSLNNQDHLSLNIEYYF